LHNMARMATAVQCNKYDKDWGMNPSYTKLYPLSCKVGGNL